MALPSGTNAARARGPPCFSSAEPGRRWYAGDCRRCSLERGTLRSVHAFNTNKCHKWEPAGVPFWSIWVPFSSSLRLALSLGRPFAKAGRERYRPGTLHVGTECYARWNFCGRTHHERFVPITRPFIPIWRTRWDMHCCGCSAFQSLFWSFFIFCSG